MPEHLPLAEGLDTVAARVDHSLCEFGMGHLAVVAFIVVLHCRQPVATLVRGMFISEFPGCHVGAQFQYRFRHARIALLHRGCLQVQVDKDKAQELLEPDLRNPDTIGIESLDASRVRRTHQSALKIIGPGMVGAGNPGPVSLSLHQLVSAMLADIEHGPQTVPRADDQDILFKERESKEIPRPRNLACMAGKLPGGEVNLPLDPLMNSGVGEVVCRQTPDRPCPVHAGP